MAKNHFPQHCTCGGDPLLCECGCRSCAQKKGRARDQQMDEQIQAKANQDPEYREMLMSFKRENTMDAQLRGMRAFETNDYFKKPARTRSKIWAQGIGAPAYATLDALISDN